VQGACPPAAPQQVHPLAPMQAKGLEAVARNRAPPPGSGSWPTGPRPARSAGRFGPGLDWSSAWAWPLAEVPGLAGWGGRHGHSQRRGLLRVSFIILRPGSRVAVQGAPRGVMELVLAGSQGWQGARSGARSPACGLGAGRAARFPNGTSRWGQAGRGSGAMGWAASSQGPVWRWRISR
jgi:hypothetical protein